VTDFPVQPSQEGWPRPDVQDPLEPVHDRTAEGCDHGPGRRPDDVTRADPDENPAGNAQGTQPIAEDAEGGVG
jgi:hypothetical protein